MSRPTITEEDVVKIQKASVALRESYDAMALAFIQFSFALKDMQNATEKLEEKHPTLFTD